MTADRKVAIVTGAASGIARATASLLVDDGWSVVLADRDVGRLGDAVGQLAGAGADVMARPTDVSNSADVAGLVAEAADFGPLRGLLNAAGVTLPGDVRVAETTDEVLDATLAVNLKGPFYTCRAALPLIAANGGGAIVNIASIAALYGNGSPAYAMSKGGVISLSRVVAIQGAASNVRCNTVCPGSTETPMLDAVRAKYGSSGVVVRSGTLERVAAPEEIGQVIAFLLSDRASYVTGAIYTADGGFTQH